MNPKLHALGSLKEMLAGRRKAKLAGMAPKAAQPEHPSVAAVGQSNPLKDQDLEELMEEHSKGCK